MSTDTSAAAHAWRKARGIDVAQNGTVYEHLAVHGPATGDELDIALEGPGWPPRAATKALNKLKRTGAVVDTGERRPTRTGRNAAVYRAVLPDEDITNHPDAASAHAELARRNLIDRVAAAIDQTTADLNPRTIRTIRPDSVDLIITIRPHGNPTRPALPA